MDQLKVTGYLKYPRQDGARVELCTQPCGKYVVVQYTPLDRATAESQPQSIHEYPLCAALRRIDNLENIPMQLDGDIIESDNQYFIRAVFEHCHGRDLEELVQYASAEGLCLPEAFIWHVIKNFIEYCTAVRWTGRTVADFDPAHVLFFFDDQVDLMRDGDVLNNIFPSVVFCGFDQLRKDGPKNNTDMSARRFKGLPNVSSTHMKAIESLGDYFLQHLKSKHSSATPQIKYSAPLITWLKLMAARDGGPPRYFDLGHLMYMLWPMIGHFDDLYKDSKLTPWLSRYFDQDQIEVDVAISHQTRSNLLSTKTQQELKKFVKASHGSCNSLDYTCGVLPFDFSFDDDRAAILRKIRDYLRIVIDFQGELAAPAIVRFREDDKLAKDNLEGVQAALMELIHHSFDRVIELHKLCPKYQKYDSDMLEYRKFTHAHFDSVEARNIHLLVKSLAYVQKISLDENRQVLQNLYKHSCQHPAEDWSPTIKDVFELLSEVENRYHNSAIVASRILECWKNRDTNITLTTRSRVALVTWRNWFETHSHSASFVLKRTSDLLLGTSSAKAMIRNLRLEVGCSEDVSVDIPREERIISKPPRNITDFPIDHRGWTYRIADYGETPEEQSDRLAKIKNFSKDEWNAYVAKLRANGTEVVSKRARSPRTRRSTSSKSSPGYKVGKYPPRHASAEEAENITHIGRPRAMPRRRSQISKDEQRKYKIFKRYGHMFRYPHFVGGIESWEGFRRKFSRQSKPLAELKRQFLHREPDHLVEMISIKTYEEACKYAEQILGTYVSKEDARKLRAISDESAKSIPVAERPETWNRPDSEGIEDESGVWVSKNTARRRGRH